MRWFLGAVTLATLTSVALGLIRPSRPALNRRTRPTRLHSTNVPASGSIEEWQALLAASSIPLQSTALSEGARVLRSHGVARFNGIVSPTTCTALRNDVLKIFAASNTAKTNDVDACRGDSDSSFVEMKDLAYVPGTRVRFSEAIDVGFAPARHDLLLPLEHPTVANALAEASRALKPVLEAAAAQLPRVHFPPKLASQLDSNQSLDSQLEVVELAALLSRPGARHQKLHGDYQRLVPEEASSEVSSLVGVSAESVAEGTDESPVEGPAEWGLRKGKLPPRLVCFVCLQDVPSVQHGGTLFLPGTHTFAAHQLLYKGPTLAANSDDSNPETMADVSAARNALLSCVKSAPIAAAAAVDPSSPAALLEGPAVGGISSGGQTNVGSGPAVCAALNCGDCLIYDASVLHWGGANVMEDFHRAVLYFGVSLPGAAASLSLEEPIPDGSVQVNPVLLRDVAASQ